MTKRKEFASQQEIHDSPCRTDDVELEIIVVELVISEFLEETYCYGCNKTDDGRNPFPEKQRAYQRCEIRYDLTCDKMCVFVWLYITDLHLKPVEHRISHNLKCN